MEDLKIKVNSEAESKEAQELFFELGAHTESKNWLDNAKWLFLEKDMEITFSSTITYHSNIEYKEITLPQLRDMVVLKQNCVDDATHVAGDGSKYLKCVNYFCFWNGMQWRESSIDFNENDLKPIEKPMTETAFLMQGKNGERLMESVGQVEGADIVNHPSHYSDSAIECIDAMEAMLGRQQFIGYLRGNMFKYQWRYQKKNGIEDLKKSEWYLNKLLEVENAGSKD